MIYVKSLLKELFIDLKLKLKLNLDNNNSILFAKNGNSKRSKHIDVKYHYLRNLENEKIIEIQKVSGEQNVSDLFTKIVKPYLRERYIKLLNLE